MAASNPLLTGLCDDAAIFPPGLKPLERAVPDHRAHLTSPHAALVGPLIVSADRLDDLGPLVAGAEGFDLTVTVPGGVTGVADVLATVPQALRLVGLEIVPVGLDGNGVVTALDSLELAPEITVWVEIPRDERRSSMIAALAGTRYRAKFRTGGVRADLYPDEAELAEAIVACVAAGLPFKATAGLHHAVRNTDDRGFEQHGFANMLVATALARSGAGEDEVRAALADRDAESVAARLRLDEDGAHRVRESFVSFGTCSIDEPRDELAALGLL